MRWTSAPKKPRKSHKVYRNKGNTTVTNLTWRKLIGSAAFGRGMVQALSGRPFDYGWLDKNDASAWDYERGRMFGIATRNAPIVLKIKAKVTNAAIYTVVESYRRGDFR